MSAAIQARQAELEALHAEIFGAEALRGRAAPSQNAPHGSWVPSTVTPSDLRDQAARGRIRCETLALLDSTGPAGYQSASEADAAIAAALASAGLTEAEAFGLVIASARGQDAIRRKGPRYAEAYWQRTVANAAAYVGPVLERPDGLRVRHLPPVRRPRGVPARTLPRSEVSA